MIRKYLYAISSLLPGFGLALFGAGIPHPEFQIHGTVFNHGDGYRRAMDIGSLQMTFESDYGKLQADARIRKTDNGINYVLEVPAEIGLLQFPAANNVVDLGTDSNQLWRISDTVWIEYYGEFYPASWERGTTTEFQIQRSAWGGEQRLDLIVEAPMFDHDGGGIPSDWERLYSTEGGFFDESGENDDGDNEGSGEGGEGGGAVNPFAGETTWLRSGEGVWVKAGVSTVLRFPVRQTNDPIDKEELTFTILSLPEEGELLWINESTGVVEAVVIGHSFTEAQLEDGHLRYRGLPGGQSQEVFDIQLTYAGEFDSGTEEVLLQVWEPYTGGSSGARLWINAQRQALDGEHYAGARNYANDLEETWTFTGDVSLPDSPNAGFVFTEGAAIAPTGSIPANALSSSTLEILASFQGQDGPVFTSAHLGLDRLGREQTGHDLVRFGRRSAAVSREVFHNGTGHEIFHGWLENENYSLGGSADLSGIGFSNPSTIPMGERAALGARLGEQNSLLQTWEGSIQELLVFSRKLNEIERARLHTYLLARSSEEAVIIDAAHSIRPVVQRVPSSPSGNGFAPQHLFLGWQGKTWFEGGSGNDVFYVGGGEHVLRGGGGANRFVFLLEGGQNHRLLDFSRQNDVLDLSVLFREPMNGPPDEFLRASRDGEDSIIEVYRGGLAQSTPSLTIRFENWLGLTQERVLELLRQGVIQAGPLEERPIVEWRAQRSEAEETGDEPAHLRLTWDSEELPTGQAIPIRIESPDAIPGEDFIVLARQMDIETGELVTAPVAEKGLVVPPENYRRIDIYIEAVLNEITDDPREVTLSFYNHPVRYRQVGEESERTVWLLDGPTVLSIEALSEHASPDSPTAFVIERMGARDQSLQVKLDVGGTAENSVDYEFISSFATIPAGETSVSIPLQPLRKVASEDANRVVLRIEEDEMYRYTDDGMARVWLAVNLRQLEIIPLSEIADSDPGVSRIAQFFVRKSEALQGKDLLVRLDLEGNVSLNNVSVTMPNVVANLSFTGKSADSILLLPASHSSFILTVQADANLVDGSFGHYVQGVFRPYEGEDFLVKPDTFNIYFKEDLESWALRNGAAEDDIMGWLLSDSGTGSLTNLEAFAYGVLPGSTRDSTTSVGVELGEDDTILVRIPYYKGSSADVSVVLERSTDLTNWTPANEFELIETKLVGDRFYNIYSGPRSEEPTFFRINLSTQ